MTKELQQTPTPIPEEFTKAMHARAVQYGGGRSGYESFTDGAEWAYRLLSSHGLRWVKADEPPKEEGYKLVSAPGSVGIWVAYWDSEDWIHPERDIDGKCQKITEFVTHWMPLPTAPIT